MEMTRILEHCIEILRLLPDILICHKTCLLSCIYSLQTKTTRHGSLAILRIAKPVGLIDRIEMRRTDCFGKTRLVLHVPSSS